MKTLTALSTLLLTAVAAGGCANKAAVDIDRGGPVAVVDPTPTFEKDHVVDKVDPEYTVLTTADTHANAHEFAEAMRKSGLDKELAQTDTLYTLFAPSDEHFDASLLGSDPAEIRKNLSYYIVPGRMTSNELTDLQKAPTASGMELDVLAAVDGSYFAVNQARVLVPNVEATNGVVHVIDSMLLPPDHPMATKLRQDSPSGSIFIDQDILTVCGIEAPRAFFAFDSSEVRGPAKETLGQLSTCVTDGPLAGETLRLEGYADPRGSAEYNKTLAAKRANAVESYLESAGVPDDQLRSVSFGERFAHDSQPMFWDYDRRVDIVLLDDTGA
ncbi:MAG: fasciclin domain-containing protein [Nannocystaceae bacterium]